MASFLDIMNGINPVLGIAGSLVGEGARNRRFMNQQTQLNNQQLRNQMKLNEQAQRLMMQTWRDTNYPAQVAMMEEAGLNPALLYSKGGPGGSTASGSGGGAQGGGAPAPPMMGIEGQLAMQGAKLASEIEVNKSIAEKNKADAKSTLGGEGTIGESVIQLNLQSVSSGKAQEALTRSNKFLADLQGKREVSTLEDDIDRAHWEANRAREEADKASSEAYVSRGTRSAQIGLINAQEAVTVLSLGLMKAQTAKTWEEARKTASDMLVNQNLADIAQQNANTNTKNAVTNQEALYWTGRAQNINLRRDDIEKALKSRGLDLQETKMVIDTFLEIGKMAKY